MIDDKLNYLLEKVSVLITNLSEFKTEFGEFKAEFGEFKGEFGEFKAEVGELRTEVGELNTKVDRIEHNLAVFKGDTMERSLRHEAELHFGVIFASSFVVCGLSGLARIVIPSKRNELGYLPRPMNDAYKNLESDESDLQRQERQMTKLIDFIYKEQNRMKLKDFIEQKIDLDQSDFFANNVSSLKRPILKQLFRTSKDVVQKMFLEFILADKGKRQRLLRSDNGFGLILFGIASGLDNVCHELDLDCRGSVEAIRSQYHIKSAEIKSSRAEAPKAIIQLTRNLSYIEAATCVCNDCLADEIVKTGFIILPALEKKVIEESLSVGDSTCHFEILYM